jgi:nicotinate-nucleotide adenylyltransferase
VRLGIFGGSFNPIHHGHLIIAQRAVESLGLDKLLLIPTGVTPRKEKGGLAAPEDRLKMVRIAVRGNPFLEASPLEVRRGGISYTIDTLRTLERPGRKLFLLLGADSARGFSRWKSPREIAERCSIGIAGRPATPGVRMPKYIGRVARIPGPLLEISSTEIRERVAKGLSVRYLVPDGVDRFLREKGLYLQ